MHEDVINFLSMEPALFHTKEEYGKINNTPRGWKRASDIYYSYMSMGIGSNELLREILCGTLERSTVELFIRYIRNKNTLVDYEKLARNVLSCDPEDWDKGLFELKDVGLNRVFWCMCELVDPKKVVELTRVSRFFVSCGEDLAHSWYLLLSRKYSSVLEMLTGIDEFADYVSRIISNGSYRKGVRVNG